MTSHPGAAQQQLEDLVKKALSLGAEAADALFVEGESLSVSWRGHKLESIEQAEGADLGLRVLFGKKQAIASTTDRSPKALTELAERVVAMAKAAPEDPFCGLAAAEEIARDIPLLETADSYELDNALLIERARAAEEGALAVAGVTQCESTESSGGRTRVTLVTSAGFAGSYERTSYSVGALALAGQGTEMERDYDYSSVVFQRDLEDAYQVGQKAGQRTVRNLGARKMPSCEVPVLFDPRESRSLLGSFAGAITGSAIARGTSFLKDAMNKPVFAEEITIIDDPHRARGFRTKAFDGEGIATQRRAIVEEGTLKTWLLDLRSARQLGLESTGHAARGTSSMPSPSPTNLYIEAGKLSPAELMRDIKSGFYVTETMGMGVNGVTGDYSQAARGFWIENGQIAFPVSEMTIAGNLKDMFACLIPANDLTFRYGIDAPTLRIDGMTVAGM